MGAGMGTGLGAGAGAGSGLGWDWRRRWAQVVRCLGRTRSLRLLSGWVASWLALWLSRSTVVGLRFLVPTSLLASEDGACRKAVRRYDCHSQLAMLWRHFQSLPKSSGRYPDIADMHCSSQVKDARHSCRESGGADASLEQPAC